MTAGKYKLIYADPPWKYNSRADHKTRFRGGAYGHYPLLTMAQIKDLAVSSVVDDNACLLMWATFPYLKDQLDVFKAWGFEYKTIGFLWAKLNPKNGKPFFGVGFYPKSNAEVCLLGIRGRMTPVTNTISQVVIAPRRLHSQKPDEVREKIVQLFGDVRRLELFAREETDGWDAMGYDLDGRDIRVALAEKIAEMDV